MDNIKQYMQENRGAATVMAAKALGLPERDIIRALEGEAVEAPLSGFDEIMKEISEWGEVLVIVTNGSVILEVKSDMPLGKYGHGMYNIHSKTSPVGGHFMADRFGSIFFVSRPFMGRESLSVQIYDKEGSASFKVYVGRDEKGELKQEQADRFHALRKRFMQ